MIHPLRKSLLRGQFVLCCSDWTYFNRFQVAGAAIECMEKTILYAEMRNVAKYVQQLSIVTCVIIDR